MAQINVTQATIAGPTGGGGYVSAEALVQGDTFVFSTADIDNKAFWIKSPLPGLGYVSLTGAPGTLTAGQTVLLVGVKAQIDG